MKRSGAFVSCPHLLFCLSTVSVPGETSLTLPSITENAKQTCICMFSLFRDSAGVHACIEMYSKALCHHCHPSAPLPAYGGSCEVNPRLVFAVSTQLAKCKRMYRLSIIQSLEVPASHIAIGWLIT